MLIYYILFSAWINFLSTIITVKPTHKVILLINYSIWWIIASYLEINYRITGDDELFKAPTHFVIHFINVTYMYEMFFYRMDNAHKLHHILSIILQQYSITSGFINTGWHVRLASSGYTTFITSVLSSSRDIVKYNYPNYNNLIRFSYKFFYIVFKLFGINLYYQILHENYDKIVLTSSFITFFIFYGMIQLIQLYFIGRIIKSTCS